MLGFKKSRGELIQGNLAAVASNVLRHGKSIYKHLWIDSTF